MINDNGQRLEINRRWNLDILNIKEKQRNIFKEYSGEKTIAIEDMEKKAQPMYKRLSQKTKAMEQNKYCNLLYKIKNILEFNEKPKV